MTIQWIPKTKTTRAGFQCRQKNNHTRNYHSFFMAVEDYESVEDTLARAEAYKRTYESERPIEKHRNLFQTLFQDKNTSGVIGVCRTQDQRGYAVWVASTPKPPEGCRKYRRFSVPVLGDNLARKYAELYRQEFVTAAYEGTLEAFWERNKQFHLKGVSV